MIVDQPVYFVIHSADLTPEQITRHLRVEPTETEVKQSRRGKRDGRLIPSQHEWRLDSDLATFPSRWPSPP
ncbi:DUF4279 domain-containing protein [Nonomuraea sp. NN258]|uniref:DUF4279 domain-containing protein n=1 Tax=Nonomuraea antri TaxID=2730852 RepID=UPI001569F38D|nr:DUF4279 domain-containing protein [Nonomuraea antri]NRQ31600.1 DUF4279 domain-containing protein [Nonomuraea antri]